MLASDTSITGMPSRTGYCSSQPVQMIRLRRSLYSMDDRHDGQTSNSINLESTATGVSYLRVVAHATPQSSPTPSHSSGSVVLSAYQVEYTVADVFHCRSVVGLHVQPQHRLGVRRPQIEPPTGPVDGQTVGQVGLPLGVEGLSDPDGRRFGLGHPGVDLARRHVLVERGYRCRGGST